MISIAVLIALLLVASVTDVRRGKIYNWTTYPGIVLALLGSGLATLLGVDATSGTETQQRILGIVPLLDSLAGFLICAAVMLVCYVFFAGKIGGGDIKLIAMVGAFLGAYAGVEAMLWTFIIGGAFALIRLVWTTGFFRLIARYAKYVMYALRLGTMTNLSDEDRKPLQTPLYLSPSALLAVLVVHFQLIELL